MAIAQVMEEGFGIDFYDLGLEKAYWCLQELMRFVNPALTFEKGHDPRFSALGLNNSLSNNGAG